MTVERVLFLIFALFALIGGLDRIFGSRLGLGKAFERGVLTMGPLALSMIGMIVLAPLLAHWLRPVVTPVYAFFGADPAMFAGSLLACDMGGEPLAKALTADPRAYALGGILVSSMLGVTVTFTVPVAMGAISGKDRPFAAKGILCGILTVPVGVFFGGLAAGLSPLFVLRNLLPILPLTLLIALGLWKAEKWLIRGFTVFGLLMTALSTVGLLLGAGEYFFGKSLFAQLAPIDEALLVVGRIALVLAGAFPMMELLTRLLRRPLGALGKKLSMNETSVGGLLSSSVNSIATFDAVSRMDPRGKVVNMAFAVSAAFVFGDHLAYTAGVLPSMILPLIVGKLTAGISAVAIALLLTRSQSSHQVENKEN